MGRTTKDSRLESLILCKSLRVLWGGRYKLCYCLGFRSCTEEVDNGNVRVLTVHHNANFDPAILFGQTRENSSLKREDPWILLVAFSRCL